MNFFSSTLSGKGVSVPPSVDPDLTRAHTDGSLSLRIIAVGRFRWKLAFWKSGIYDIKVICDAVASFQNGSSPLTPLKRCTTFLH
ncbi:hypothetical protein L195_g061030 [Trifolium pratense]|uniref:Uncharacterized protein n=1 Tax=Trifolium pratense TaxID=57577 RepID=A0A2K3K7D5_TRIPR|nr:hypothetical protein L195_g061030 [Trifolium pratense]